MIAHARQSVLAAWQLVVRDPKAWDSFDLTADGFFRSFAAVLFVIPFNIVFDLFALRLRQAGGLDAVDAGTEAGDIDLTEIPVRGLQTDAHADGPWWGPPDPIPGPIGRTVEAPGGRRNGGGVKGQGKRPTGLIVPLGGGGEKLAARGFHAV